MHSIECGNPLKAILVLAGLGVGSLPAGSSHFVIASPIGASPAEAKQSSAKLEKIASSGKERPPRNDSDRLVVEIFIIQIFPILIDAINQIDFLLT